jgi:hypothetical protein
MRRFFIRHFATGSRRTDSDWTLQCETLEVAKGASDRVRSVDGAGVGQEIIDSESGERWLKQDATSDWSPVNPARSLGSEYGGWAS